MKLKLLTTLVLSTLSLTLSAPLVAQNPPAKTYQPGFWQPVARVNLSLPVKIQLINETDALVEYGLSANAETPPTPISPGNTAVMTEVSVPAYLLINFVSSEVAQSGQNLQFDVTVNQDNVIITKIRQVDSSTPGDTTLNLQETGAIYIY